MKVFRTEVQDVLDRADHEPRAYGPGPRDELARETRDMWRGGRNAEREDAEAVLQRASGDPRERLAAETRDMWRADR